jgi:hypothetical protein
METRVSERSDIPRRTPLRGVSRPGNIQCTDDRVL